MARHASNIDNFWARSKGFKNLSSQTHPEQGRTRGGKDSSQPCTSSVGGGIHGQQQRCLLRGALHRKHSCKGMRDRDNEVSTQISQFVWPSFGTVPACFSEHLDTFRLSLAIRGAISKRQTTQKDGKGGGGITVMCVALVYCAYRYRVRNYT